MRRDQVRRAGGLRRLGGIALAVAAVALSGMAPADPPKLMSWPDLLGRPKPALKPEHIAYGDDPSQVVDLWRPPTPGPHPVVAMIHGGCWTKSIASLHIMDWAAADLAQRGVAVWNIEYRGVDEKGGGYPGAFRDVASALDRLKAEAAQRGLLPGKALVVVGHSAGGHLALWSAAHARVARGGVLKIPQTADVRAVVDLAGLADLERDTQTGCGPEPVAQMAGSPPAYAATSPAHMLPLKAELFVIHGAQDTTVAPDVGERFAIKARAAGDTVHVSTPPGGHVEEISPGSEAWEKTIAPLIVRLAKGEAK